MVNNTIHLMIFFFGLFFSLTADLGDIVENVYTDVFSLRDLEKYDVSMGHLLLLIVIIKLTSAFH